MAKEEQYLNEYLEYLQHIKRFSEHTVRAYKQDINQFLNHFKDDNLQVNRKTIHDFIAILYIESRKKTTVKRKVFAVKSFYTYLHKNSKIPKNPFDAISTPRIDNMLPEILAERDVLEFLDRLPTSTFIHLRNKAAFEFLYATGLRVSELTGLKLQDINFDERMVRILGKGNKVRIIPFYKKALDILNAYLEEARNKFSNKFDHVFLNARGKPITPRAIEMLLQDNYRQIMETNRKVYPHLFRHAFATHLLQRGADLKTIQELLGHSSLSTTQKYTHIDYTSILTTYSQCHPRA